MTTVAMHNNAREMKVFLNHIYEFKKGIRQMILYTMHRRHLEFAIFRLNSQGIEYHIQELRGDRVNLFFGRRECVIAIKMMIDRPLNELSAEQDFILGAVLGYDICGQCERYVERATKN
ncbi:MAG: DUF2023 family protein [Rikenellaceae bacterium]